MLDKDDEVKGQKSEKLIERIFKAHTKEGDLVVDFFLGSGTSAAVAHKMGLKYIGVEQLDKHIDISLRRLDKVLKGEQSGISKNNNWKGGGSFVYCELLEDNESLVRELEKASDSQAIKEVLDKAIENGKLVPSVLPDDLIETERDFDELSLEDQKKLAMELLDKNKLYINLSDIEDESFEINEADKKFTKSFYGLD